MTTRGRLSRLLSRNWRGIAAGLALSILVLAAGLVLSHLHVRSTQSHAVTLALNDARHAADQYRASQAEVPLLESRLKDLQASTPASAEYLQRRPLFEAQRALREREQHAGEQFNLAVLAAQRGLEVQSGHTELLDLLSGLLWDKYLSLERGGSAEELRRVEAQIVSYAPAFREKLKPRGTLSISSQPGGAEVYLFRYQPVEMLLQPVPYHPWKGPLLGPDELPPPAMVVVRDPPEKMARGVARGDRVVSIGGQPVRASGNRLFAINYSRRDRVTVELERDGKKFEAIFPPHTTSSSPLWDLQDCVATDSFPLAFLEEGVLGNAPVEGIDLEGGSYLAVLRFPGFRDTRVPFLVTRDRHLHLSVDLYTDAEIGEELVYVPRGPAILGGDAGGFYPEARREEDLPGFLIARNEVTVESYFEFLNDPQVRQEIAGEKQPGPHFLLPVDMNGRNTEALFSQDSDGTYRPQPRLHDSLRWISRLAAERYVRWLNDREASRGGKRTFSLPTADQLEKAARGADGRLFPWGNSFDWSLVCSYRTRRGTRKADYSTDVSPYGVQDLAGSVSEFTSTDEEPPPWHVDGDQDQDQDQERLECRIKGGSKLDDLEPFFHIAGHTLERVSYSSDRIGFRVVATVPGR